jgi:hypothetical protein
MAERSRYDAWLRAWLSSSPGRVKNFPLHVVQTSSEAHPVTYPMSIGGSFPGIKRKGREADHSPPSSAEVKNDGAVTPLPSTCSWPGTSLIKRRDNLPLPYISTHSYAFMV